MTGPEHYREAERLLTRDRDEVHDGVTYRVYVPSDRDIAEAQVHATLALAAATAQNIRRNNAMDAGLADDWIQVSR